MGREGFGSHNWKAEGACIDRGRGDVATAGGMPCFLPGILSLDHRTLAVVDGTGSLEGCG